MLITVLLDLIFPLIELLSQLWHTLPIADSLLFQIMLLFDLVLIFCLFVFNFLDLVLGLLLGGVTTRAWLASVDFLLLLVDLMSSNFEGFHICIILVHILLQDQIFLHIVFDLIHLSLVQNDEELLGPLLLQGCQLFVHTDLLAHHFSSCLYLSDIVVHESHNNLLIIWH